MTCKHPPRALTIVEVLVLLIVAMIVVALVVPAMLAAREATRRAQCENHLKQLALGVDNYATVYRTFPCGTVVNESLRPEKRLSWIVRLLPFFQSLMGGLSVDWNKPWDAPENMPPKTRIMTFDTDSSGYSLSDWVDYDVPLAVCPSNRTPKHSCGLFVSNYVGIAGVGADAARLPIEDPRAGIWGYDRATKPDQVAAGLGYTLLLAETARDNGPWTTGGPATVRGVVPDARPPIGPGAQFGGLHPGGCMASLANGVVKFFSNETAPEVFYALSTVAAEESLPGEAFTEPPQKEDPTETGENQGN